MKEAFIAMNHTADSKPVFTAVIGMVTGWGTAILSYMEVANIFMKFIATTAGTIAAVYAAATVVRRFHRGYTKRKALTSVIK